MQLAWTRGIVFVSNQETDYLALVQLGRKGLVHVLQSPRLPFGARELERVGQKEHGLVGWSGGRCRSRRREG